MNETPENNGSTPQCQYFVVRKKRLCRMTVRPGRQYCGEHEPQPKTEEGEDDKRIPCPLDPKHTCYESKLEKHLSICNARASDNPPYIIWNVNAPPQADDVPRRPLCQYPRETLVRVIRKVNELYEKHVEGNIMEVPEEAIHPCMQAEFGEAGRTESSRRHLRQATALLRLAERAGLVRDRTCYVELGAGKGQLSYYMGVSWCGPGTGSSVLAVDRAAMRHKKDAKLRGPRASERETLQQGESEKETVHQGESERDIVYRLRADLRHVALEHAPPVAARAAVVGVAKHLCGVATDYALRCVTGVGSARGLVLAPCCHHRCEQKDFFANEQLQELGITAEEFNVMLGIVSWATCGDGRSRRRRKQIQQEKDREQRGDHERIDQTHHHIGESDTEVNNKQDLEELHIIDKEKEALDLKADENIEQSKEVTIKNKGGTQSNDEKRGLEMSGVEEAVLMGGWSRAETGRRAKALVEWARCRRLAARGWRATLARYVTRRVSPENIAILATRDETPTEPQLNPR